jgi:sugar O-acyltransferase (sialic acid O-acetyltransferase NeuD family)
METWLNLVPLEQRDWAVEGFLHSPTVPSPLAGFPSGCEIVGDWRGYAFSKEDYVVIAVSAFEWKERIWSELHGRVQFFTYIAPTAMVTNFCDVGEGSVIGPNCIVGPNVTLGRGVTVNSASGIGHDSQVGDFASIMTRVTIGGKVHVGARTAVGSGAVVIPGISVGENATIGAGSVVIRDVKTHTTVFGNPAKRIWDDNEAKSRADASNQKESPAPD